MELVHECTFRAHLDPEVIAVGNGPYGGRSVATVTDGRVEGHRLRGDIKGAGADWLLIGADGFVRVDVRAQLVTDDGAGIYITYLGLLEMNAAVLGAMGGGETSFDDQYFRTTPRMETGDPRYDWVNTTMFAARGRMIPGGVEYEVYRLT
ncbi:MAG: DUF3237 domain-containing protein [Ilumatobacteraceae bacterium]|jgi:hypothetical protein|nr:DUF3237 domain-containing protein [Ilumatobacteraceae bacterium]